MLYLIGQLGMGGSERQLFLLLKNLDRSRFEAQVVVFNDSPYETFESGLEEAGVEVVKVPSASKRVWSRIWWLLGYLRRERFDVVHSWTAHDNLYAGVVGALAGVPVRWGSIRGSLQLEGFRSLSGPVRALILRSPARLVVNSESIRRELLAAGVRDNRIIVLANCVEVARDRDGSVDLSARGIESRHRLIGIVGNLRPVKNQRMFIHSMAQVLTKHGDLRAVVVGQPIDSAPGYQKLLQAEIDSLGLTDRVVLLGFRADVSALMERFEVLCLTSRNEGLPNVVLEAMAAGTPVVATRVGGVPELIANGETGLLVELDDVEALADQVLTVLENRELAGRLSRAGRQRVERRHDCLHLVRGLEDHYDRAMGRDLRAKPVEKTPDPGSDG